MHWKITAPWGGKKVELRETQRAVTPFGGLVVLFEFLRRIGYCEAVRRHLPLSQCYRSSEDLHGLFARSSPERGASPTPVCCAPTPPCTRCWESPGFGFPSTTRFATCSKRFGQGQCQRFFSGLWNWQFERLLECAPGYSLDLDSTVFEL